MPFFIVGVIISALLHVFVSEETIRRFFPKNRGAGLLMACLLGIVFPACECGIVPIARRLVSKGVPLYSAVAFMLAAPVINPVVASSTAVAFNGYPAMVWLRLGLAFGVALLAGMLISVLVRGSVLKGGPRAHHCGCSGCHSHHHYVPFTTRTYHTFQVAGQEFFEMGRYLILGALLAASAQIMIDQQSLTAVGESPLASILVMMSFAFGISVCSSADAFIAASFTNSFTTGSLLAFLVFGPMVDIKNIFMLLQAFHHRFVLLLVGAVFILVAGSTYLINIR